MMTKPLVTFAGDGAAATFLEDRERKPGAIFFEFSALIRRFFVKKNRKVWRLSICVSEIFERSAIFPNKLSLIDHML
jgi:hypothetical protein